MRNAPAPRLLAEGRPLAARAVWAVIVGGGGGADIGAAAMAAACPILGALKKHMISLWLQVLFGSEWRAGF